jgi:hypothetical protein
MEPEMPAFTSSLEAALFGRYAVGSPYQWICDTLEAARARHEARKSYRYLLDCADARRDIGVSAGDVARALSDLR